MGCPADAHGREVGAGLIVCRAGGYHNIARSALPSTQARNIDQAIAAITPPITNNSGQTGGRGHRLVPGRRCRIGALTVSTLQHRLRSATHTLEQSNQFLFRRNAAQRFTKGYP